MSTNETFNQLVQNLTQDITTQVHAQVQNVIAGIVQGTINEMVTPEIINSAITNYINQNLDRFTPDMSVFDQRIIVSSAHIADELSQRADRVVFDLVSQQLARIDVKDVVSEFVGKTITADMGSGLFPERFIPGSSIMSESLFISGNNVGGGVIQKFTSTGIEDQASSCKLTIMDQGVVFENNLYAPRMEIRGDLIVDGALVIRGGMDADTDVFKSIVQQTSAAVQNTIGPDLLDKHQAHVFETIRTQGIELGKLSINGQEIFVGRAMSPAIIDSQLQTVGRLRDLQTQGETLLSETLYTTQKRVGINTMEPATALSIWDEEIELGIGKQQKDIARIATRREQKLVLGSNNQDNITLSPDGSVSVTTITIGSVTLGSSATPPNHNAPRGIILFNEQPNLGGPLGWVSLGDARWANFGIID